MPLERGLLPVGEAQVTELNNDNQFFQDIYDDPSVIWMGQNTNHFPTSEAIKCAMVNAITKEEYHKYPPPYGLEQLRQLILQDLNLSSDHTVHVTEGGTESLYQVTRALLKPGDVMISTDPGYYVIHRFAELSGARILDIPIYSAVNDYKLTPEMVNESMDEHVKMLTLVDPLNPLGVTYTSKEVKAFSEIAGDAGIYLLNDVTYRDVAKIHTLAADFYSEGTITIYSFSKNCGLAGLRLGAHIATHELMEQLAPYKINDLGTSTISQIAGIVALKTKFDWLPNVVESIMANQAIIKEAVDQIEGAYLPVYPSQGSMFVIDIVGTKWSPDYISNEMLKRGFFIRPAEYTTRRFANRYVRVSFALPKQDVERFAVEFPKVF
ncbi:MAG: pyridoxal phosphate-dependent aminotransferase [Halobacteriota archaeon]